MNRYTLNRWIAVAALLSAFCFVPIREASAQDMAAKFGRGAANTTLGALELPGTVRDMVIKHGPLKGYTLGFFKGLGMVPVRTAVGVYESLTFFIPSPPNYKAILSPETPLHYFYEDWEPQYVSTPVEKNSER